MGNYIESKEKSINSRLIKHSVIIDLADKHKNEFVVDEIGKSTFGKEIFSFKFGNGSKDILIWSQMHGNEPTATGAIFDLLNYFSNNSESKEVINIKKNLTITFIPMLNPDGASKWTRVNGVGIDLNRDAVQREAKESMLLWDIIDVINPDYCFNLHDQRNIFNVGNTSKPAVISFLSASFNKTRAINNDRELTMSLIAEMNDSVQKLLPNHVGRYTDEFYPTATGDNLHKLGFKNILIESGTNTNDAERQTTREANFVAILKALETIVKGVKTNRVEDYKNIPENNNKLFDLVIRNVQIRYDDFISNIDIGIMYNELPNEDYTKMEKHSRIEFIGDLSLYFGHIEHDASGELFSSNNLTYPELNQKADFTIVDMIVIENGEILS